jgi:uncharacterized membrane protein
MASPASIGKHPIHPMLIPFPFALWTFSLIADLIYFLSGYTIWRDWVAFYTLAGGIVGAVLAAVPGIIDYFSLKDPKVSKIAAWHARLNVLALLVFAASLYLRTAGGSQIVNGSYVVPFALSVVGVLLISVSGWLGGELVYVHQVAVEPKPEARRQDNAPRRVA